MCLGIELRKNRPLVPQSNSRTTVFYRSVWGLAHVFNNKLFFTRDIMDPCQKKNEVFFLSNFWNLVLFLQGGGGLNSCRCCLGLRLRLGFWNVKMLGDCIMGG